MSKMKVLLPVSMFPAHRPYLSPLLPRVFQVIEVISAERLSHSFSCEFQGKTTLIWAQNISPLGSFSLSFSSQLSPAAKKKKQPMALVLYWKTCDRQPRGANWLVSGRRQCLLDLFLNPLLPVLTLSASLCFPNKRLLPPGPPLPGVQSLHSHSRTCSLPLY